MESILISWIGGNDLKAKDREDNKTGPIMSALGVHKFSKAYLLYNYSKKEVTPYLDWLSTQTETAIEASFY